MILTLYKCPEYTRYGPDQEFIPSYCVNRHNSLHFSNNKVIDEFPSCGRFLCMIQIDTEKCDLTEAQIFARAVEQYQLEGTEKKDVAEALHCEYLLDT